MPGKHAQLPAVLAIALLSACGQGAGGAEATDATPAAATTISSNQTGTDGGMFYSFWKTSNGSASMTLDGSNGYSVSWSNIGDITCGKGWSTGSGHTVTFSGSHNNSGGGGFGIYGWTKNPLIEYYITEQPGQQGTSNGDQVGTFTSDGSTYVIRKHQQVNQPCITGDSCTFWQFISVRQSPRTSGVITIQNHFNAWKNLGLNLGSHDYQILLTESWNGSGNGSGKISEGGTSSSSSSSSSSGGTSSSGGGTSCKGYVGISFDDGPGSNTNALVNALKSAGLTPVTFFNIGQNVAANSSLVAVEKQVGEVQNHSYTHQHMTSWSQSQIYDELNRTNQAIQNAGASKPTLFRLPYGESSSAIQAAASQAGVRAMTWDVDSQDWNGASTSAIVNAANQLQNGQVILMHDAYPNTTNQAISQIAANLKAKGLCPGRIDPSTGKAVAPSGSSSSSSSSSSGGTGSSSGGSTGSCYVTGTAGSSGNGWYNLNLTVTGASAWTVTANMAGNSKVSATWNVSASYPSASQLVAKSNGSGNSWGMTITTNGTWTWPTFSCVPN